MNAGERKAAINAACSLGIVAKLIPAIELAKALRIEHAAAALEGHESARFRALITMVESLVWFVAANDELQETFAGTVVTIPPEEPAPAVPVPDDWAA